MKKCLQKGILFVLTIYRISTQPEPFRPIRFEIQERMEILVSNIQYQDLGRGLSQYFEYRITLTLD